METTKKNIKEIVRTKYDQIARQSKLRNQSSCCGGTACCSDEEYMVISDDYTRVQGYMKDADLGLGCGIPSDHANLREGDVVLDLGSGAGNDCFVARSFVGDTGYVYGLDFADEMLQKARINLEKLGFDNIEFVKGDIEHMPFGDNTMDKVISNCVLNLVPDKKKAFGEILRVLKPGGSFCVSDVVIRGKLPEALVKDAEMYVGCVAGAISKDKYIKVINDTGFKDVQIHKEREIVIPDEILSGYLSEEELHNFKSGTTGIFSMTISAIKPDS
jgi:ubiquinone/menaquinone biosynthesis C-methylase UbiE